MTSWLDWGIDVVLWVQQGSPTLDIPFILLTFVGDEHVFLPLLPLLYWCVDRHTGARVGLLLLFSSVMNALAKDLFQQPRPFAYDSRVRQIVPADGEGFPSGHTQATVVFWGYIAAQLHRSWVWGLAGCLMLLVPLSRLYVGNHFPTDLLGGYVLGGMILLLYRWLTPGIEPWLKRQGVLRQVAAAVGVPLLLFLLAGDDRNSQTAAAMLLGVGYGVVLERRWVGFETSGPLWQRAARFVVGAIGLGILFGILHVLFKSLEPASLFRLLRYGLVGLWIGYGAPWVFVACGLAPTRRVRCSARL